MRRVSTGTPAHTEQIHGERVCGLCQRCTLRGFSSSSLSAFTLVRSCSSSRPRWCTKR